MAKEITTSNDEPSTASSEPSQADIAALASADAGLEAVEVPPEPAHFEDWKLAPTLMRALGDMGYDRPMPVQEAVFETLTEGDDLMVQSKTGSGKTAAFGIPIAQMLSDGKKGVQSLILAPTRELALQVAKEIEKLVIHMDVAVVPIYGGAPIGPQIKKLEDGGQIVAGTPGRVLDHIRRGTMDTSGIRMLVLDECDEMLSMGFQEEIENIVSTLPAKDKRQTMLFSATIPKEIERIGRRHMREPKMLTLSSDSVGAELIDHYYYVVSGMARNRDLLKLMKAEKPDSAIIFCNTRDETNTVARYLRKNGYDSEALSSDLSQSDRERVMGRMRDKNLNFLVATDIAARGIDISELSHVINYTFPSSPEVYVHRSGRTGRAGKEGTALSLVGPREIGAFYYLKLIYKIIPTERDLPNADEMAAIEEGELYERVIAMLEGDARKEHIALARRLWQSNEGERVVALLLQRLLTKPAKKPAAKPAAAQAPVTARETSAPVAESGSEEERPRRKRRRRGRDEDQVVAKDTTGSAETAVEVPATAAAEAPAKAAVEVPDATEAEAAAEAPVASAAEVVADPDATTEERPRRKRRRRRGQAEEGSETPPLAADAAPEASTEAEVVVTEAPEVEAVANEAASSTEEPAEAQETAEAASVDEPQEAADDTEKPRRKRRRRGRGSSSEESEAKAETVSAAKGEEEDEVGDTQEVKRRFPEKTAKKKAVKGRERKPRTDAGVHGEFWEAWADSKQDAPSDDAEVVEAKSSSDEEEDAKPAKKRRRRRRSSKDAEDVTDSDDGSVRAEAPTSDDAPDDNASKSNGADEPAADESEAPSDPSVRLFVNVGKREDADVEAIRSFLGEALGETAEQLGRITLRNTHCYIRVPEDFADEVIDACTGLVFHERGVVVERARAKR